MFLQEGYVISSCTVISGVVNTIHFSKYNSISFTCAWMSSARMYHPYLFQMPEAKKKIKGSGETYSNCTAGSVSGDHNHWNPFAVLLHPWSLVCLWWWWVRFHFWMHFGYSASQKYSHREHSGSLILYHRILWNYDLCLNRKNKRKDCLLPKKTKFWCTGLKWQRIHQIPKYFFVVIHLHLICIQTSLFLV